MLPSNPILIVLHMTVALFTASRMLYVWHNRCLAAIRYHLLLLLVNLHHTNCFLAVPFLTASRLFLFGITFNMTGKNKD